MRAVLAAWSGTLQVDAVVCDPPYNLTGTVERFGKPGSAPAKSNGPTGVYARASRGFMGNQWDGTGIAFDPATWTAVMSVMKPGAYLLAFGGARTWHRLWCAIEDAGFIVQDTIMWVYGSGWTRSPDAGMQIEKHLGGEGRVVQTKTQRNISRAGVPEGTGMCAAMREGPSYVEAEVREPTLPEAVKWKGWSRDLKASWEPVIVARKPPEGSLAENLLEHGCGALNVDACRVPVSGKRPARSNAESRSGLTGTGGANTYGSFAVRGSIAVGDIDLGRRPANLLHDGSNAVIALFPESPGQQARARTDNSPQNNRVYGAFNHVTYAPEPHSDSGSAARFFNALPFEVEDFDPLFYCPKAAKADRAGSAHPTVKPQALMRYLCRLVTPPSGTILDPFAGSGSTLQAALAEGFNAIGIELETEYQEDIRRRMAAFEAKKAA